MELVAVKTFHFHRETTGDGTNEINVWESKIVQKQLRLDIPYSKLCWETCFVGEMNTEVAMNSEFGAKFLCN